MTIVLGKFDYDINQEGLSFTVTMVIIVEVTEIITLVIMNLIFSNEDYYISGIENVFKTKKQATGNNDDNWSYKLVFSVAMSDFEE